MTKVKIYQYSGCDSCRKALKWLNEQGIGFEKISIREQPPTKAEILQAVAQWGWKAVFNVSGGDYRELQLKDKLDQMSDEEKLALLSERGNLVKRPFVLCGEMTLLGFKQDLWASTLRG